MVKNLIVNADDLGWTTGVNRGIVDGHARGIVTSASLLANGRAFAGGVELARTTPGLGVGVHLNLSDGAPVMKKGEVQSLVSDDGEFARGPQSLLLGITRGRVALHEIEKEWDAQIRKVIAAGVTPTHLDGHKHIHMLPGLFEIALRLAKHYGIEAIRIAHEASKLRAWLSVGKRANRLSVMKQGIQAQGLKLLAREARKQVERAGLKTAEYFCGIAQTGEFSREGLESLLRNLPEGTTELMCHPGYADADLRESPTRLQDSRQSEVELLTDVGIRKLVASQGIRLLNYGFVGQCIPEFKQKQEPN